MDDKFTVQFEITDFDIFKDVVSTLKAILNDERIPFEVREEYTNKLKDSL